MIAPPVIRDYTVPQGADFPIRMRYMVDSTPVDLTGAEIRAQLKKTYGSAAIYTATLENDKAYLDTVDGWFGFDLVAEDTTLLEAITYVYDLEVVLASGDVTRAMQGKINLTPEVTTE